MAMNGKGNPVVHFFMYGYLDSLITFVHFYMYGYLDSLYI